MGELDDQLREWAIAAQKHPPRSPQRQRLLDKLIRTLLNSDQLVKPKRHQFKKFYAEIYAEAKQRLFYHLCARIDDYDPEKGKVLQWVNYLMEKRFFIEASRWVLQSIPRGAQRLSIDELETQMNTRERPLTPEQVDPEITPLASEQIVEMIKNDPEDLFKKTYVSGQPDANFQFLALRVIEGYSWQETADQLGIKLVTLNRFYHRHLTRFSPLIQDYLST